MGRTEAACAMRHKRRGQKAEANGKGKTSDSHLRGCSVLGTLRGEVLHSMKSDPPVGPKQR